MRESVVRILTDANVSHDPRDSLDILIEKIPVSQETACLPYTSDVSFQSLFLRFNGPVWVIEQQEPTQSIDAAES